jgi:guanylate kinase
MIRIVICGTAGSGKDTLKDALVERGARREVSYTTRPMRNGEVDGSNYHYVTKEKFEEMVAAGELYQWAQFGDHLYGTSEKEWREKDVFIMTPTGISKIRPEDRRSTLVIFLNPSHFVRVDRMLTRGDSPDSIQSRERKDDAEFLGFRDYDLCITQDDSMISDSMIKIIR